MSEWQVTQYLAQSRKSTVTDRNWQMAPDNRPLVTFILLSFNQALFIKEAVFSVLAQTYSPLEIIISDDSSNDNTVAIIEEATRQYTGKHKIILNYRTRNGGVGAHINELIGLASGELIVVGAGDDISMPDRVEILVDNWLKAGCPPALCSQAVVISKEGAVISDRFGNFGHSAPESQDAHNCIESVIADGQCILLGCTEAWSKDLFRIFGPIRDDITHEDNAVSLRAWLVGQILFLDKALVYYRLHDHNLAHTEEAIIKSPAGFIAREQDNAARQSKWFSHLAQHEQDLAVAFESKIIDAPTFQRYTVLLRKKYQLVKIQCEWWSLPPFARLKIILAALTEIHRPLLVWTVPRLFGIATFAYLRSIAGQLSRIARRFGLRAYHHT